MASTALDNKTILYDVVLIRIILIILLVMYHAFAPYCGAWEPFDGQVSIDSYWWIGKFAYSFMLPAFFVVSGYVFGYSVLKNRYFDFRGVIKKKIKRLIFPLLVFGVVYVFLFYDVNDKPFVNIAYSIISGAGHLWFLLVLFECFVAIVFQCGLIFSIRNKRIESIISFSLLFVAITLSVISFSLPYLPFRLNLFLYYYVFFYAGYILRIKGNTIQNIGKLSLGGAISLASAFLAAFVIGTLFIRESTYSTEWINNIITITTSSIGIILLFSASHNLLKNEEMSRFLANQGLYLSQLCFGIYIFQEFILKVLYYKSPFLKLFSSDLQFLVPWVGMAVTLIVSYLLCRLFERNKVGRFLLGL